MENLAHSQKRHIYPDLTTQCHIEDEQYADDIPCSDSHLSSYSLSSSDDQRYFFSNDLEDIRAAYLAMNYQQVVSLARQAFERFRESARSQLIKKNVANLTLDLSKLRNLMANAYINLYKAEKKQIYLVRARNCLSFEYQDIQTPYKRAQRLNNLGLSQLLRGRYNTAFHHFSSAFTTYLQDGELRLAGLVKNIGQAYKQLEMYHEAIRYFSFVMEEIEDRKGGGELNEYACITVSVLQCINECPDTTTPLHLSICQRVKQLITKLDKQRVDDAFLRGKMRLELVKFAVGFGIQGKCISEEEAESIFHEVFAMNNNQPRIKFMKGECCYAYRQHFRGNNWEKYRQLSRLAQACFNSSLRG